MKGIKFHAKEFEFILQVAENWKIFEMGKGYYEPTCDLGRKSQWQSANEIEWQEIKSKR